MKIFAMVTTKHSEHYTVPGVESFFRQTELEEDDLFFLIDNDATQPADERRERYHELSRGKLHVIVNKQPRGFAENVNQLLAIAKSYRADLFFLNNDIIFTTEWLPSLLIDEPVILSPLSNREVNYRTDNFKCATAMQLEEYLGHEAAFEEVVALHRQQAASGYYNVIVLPFFAVKLPYSVYSVVGELDESYGRGGGEDYDYCVRAILAGFEVKYSLVPFILHFGGKSSWSGAETQGEQERRELLFRTRFEELWGRPLADLILYEKRDVIERFPGLQAYVERGELRHVVQTLLQSTKG